MMDWINYNVQKYEINIFHLAYNGADAVIPQIRESC